MSTDNISSVLAEDRAFAPSASFTEQSHISADEAALLTETAIANPVGFWEVQAQQLMWHRPWDEALKWNAPHAEWFGGGLLNVSENCLDRHETTWRKNKAAIIWEAEDGQTITLTYAQLLKQVKTCASVLRDLGVKKGDVVGIYMGMIPEAIVAMLACARIGATHNVVFGGFSADAVAERMNDSQAVVVITQDAAFRRGDEVPLKDSVDIALEKTTSVREVLVVKRSERHVSMTPGRDHWWHDMMLSARSSSTPEVVDSEHPLFILYTSGSTGKPKGILHTSAGYLTQTTWTSKHVFDLKDEDVYFCTADIGWITGHSYIVYGPLSNGATVVIYEGAPTYPNPDRLWSIVEKYGVTVFYTAPTAIRAFMKCGEQWPRNHDLSSLRLLGTVGEPINPEAWMWYYTVIGAKNCPIVDTWWQTETGAIMISPLPGATTCTPGTATKPLPGVIADVVDKEGKSCPANVGGLLVIKHPWPSMIRTIHGDDQRFVDTYWSEFPETSEHPAWYFTGDGARRDANGNIWIIGRVDDVVNVSGHRLGTAEIESALITHAAVAEAAVVSRPDEVKGNALIAFVTLKDSFDGNSNKLAEQLRIHVANEIGSIAKPDEVRISDALPKTRSGKIMRRLLRELVSKGNVSGDVTTLEDSTVLERLRLNSRDHED